MTLQTRAVAHSFVDILIAKNNPFAEVTFRGAVTREILDESFFGLLEHPDFKFNMNACYDYSDAFSELEMAGIQEHSQFVSAHLEQRGNHYKLALVSNDTLNHALLSVYTRFTSRCMFQCSARKLEHQK